MHREVQRERGRGRLLKLSENNEKRSPACVQVQRERTGILLVLKMEVWVNLGKITNMYDNIRKLKHFCNITL